MLSCDSSSTSNGTPAGLQFSTQEAELIEKEKLMDVDAKRRLLIHYYQTCEPSCYNKETLAFIGKTVKRVIVRKVKFIQNEHTCGMTKKMVETTRKFPSFWQPDLTNSNTIQADLFREMEDLSESSLRTKVMAWMGMRSKVMSSIRQHRGVVSTAIQSDVLDGMIFVFYYIDSLNR